MSEELLGKVLRGLSCRKEAETVVEAAEACGVSASSVSRHLIAATAKQRREVTERSLSVVAPLAICLDPIHRGGEASLIGWGRETAGDKMALGFWQGATENHEMGDELVAERERRGVQLSRTVIWVTDGGKGIITAWKDRCGKTLLPQRCTIHKDRNIERHVPKRDRNEAHRLLRTALEQNRSEEARPMLLDMENWLRGIHESAADSLMEAREEILTLYRLKGPALLRKALSSTTPLESMVSTVRDVEGTIKRSRHSRMLQRWLRAVLLSCEKEVRRIKGYTSIPAAIRTIEAEEEGAITVRMAA